MWAGLVTINILPDDVLLIIFLYDRSWHQRWHLNWNWHRLAHVCQRWRSVVFAYPNFLNLRLVCGPTTRVELAGIRPPVPIILKDTAAWNIPEDYDFEAAIVHHSRVCELNLLSLSKFQSHRLVAAMQDKSSSLIHLVLGSRDSNLALTLPDWFLCGSAPRLQSLEIETWEISFPMWPSFIPCAPETPFVLYGPCPWNIPDSGHISPDAIVTSLAVLAKLKYLTTKRDDKDLALRF